MALTEARSVHQVPVGGLLYKQVRLHLLQFKTAQPLNRKTHTLVPKMVLSSLCLNFTCMTSVLGVNLYEPHHSVSHLTLKLGRA